MEGKVDQLFLHAPLTCHVNHHHGFLPPYSAGVPTLLIFPEYLHSRHRSSKLRIFFGDVMVSSAHSVSGMSRYLGLLSEVDEIYT